MEGYGKPGCTGIRSSRRLARGELTHRLRYSGEPLCVCARARARAREHKIPTGGSPARFITSIPLRIFMTTRSKDWNSMACSSRQACPLRCVKIFHFFTLNKPLPRGFRRFFVNIDVPRDKVTHVTWVRDVDVELSVTRLSIRIHRQSITLR